MPHVKNEFERMMDEAEDKILAENLNEAVEAFVGIAQYLAKAGYSKEQFNDLRVYMVERACLKAQAKGVEPAFIYERLGIIEEAARNERNQDRKIIITH